MIFCKKQTKNNQTYIVETLEKNKIEFETHVKNTWTASPCHVINVIEIQVHVLTSLRYSIVKVIYINNPLPVSSKLQLANKTTNALQTELVFSKIITDNEPVPLKLF